jgi:hypothetical protein
MRLYFKLMLKYNYEIQTQAIATKLLRSNECKTRSDGIRNKIEFKVCECRPSDSSHTVALGLTQPRTNELQKMFLGSRARPAHKTNSLTGICEPTV